MPGACVRTWCLVLVVRHARERDPDGSARALQPSTTRFSMRASNEVDALLKQACPPAPDGACQVLRVVSLWWQIQLDPESRLLDRRFTELAASTIAANEAWTRREPQRAEAWFYLAGAYAPSGSVAGPSR